MLPVHSMSMAPIKPIANATQNGNPICNSMEMHKSKGKKITLNKNSDAIDDKKKKKEPWLSVEENPLCCSIPAIECSIFQLTMRHVQDRDKSGISRLSQIEQTSNVTRTFFPLLSSHLLFSPFFSFGIAPLLGDGTNDSTTLNYTLERPGNIPDMQANATMYYTSKNRVNQLVRWRHTRLTVDTAPDENPLGSGNEIAPSLAIHYKAHRINKKR